MIDAVIAYDDVLDIGWGVWGDQWEFDLDHLTASFTNPALDPDDPLYRVWGHVVDVDEARPGRRRDRPRRRQGDARGRRRRLRDRRRAAGDDAARPGQGLSGGAGSRRGRGAAGDPRLRAGRSTDDFNSPWNRFKRFVGDTRAAARARDRGARLADRRCCSPGWRASATPGCPSTCPSRPTTPTPALAYGLAHEGGDSDRHGARDAARPRRPRLLRRPARRRPRRRSSTSRSKQRPDRPAEELTDYEQEVLALLRRAARRRAGRDERDEGRDPEALASSGAGAGSG